MTCPEDSLAELFLEIGSDLGNDNLIFPTCLTLNLKIRQMLDEEERDSRDLTNLIRTDPLITGKVLRMANSQHFNRSGRKVRTLDHAVTLIGTSSIRTIVHITTLQQFVRDTRSNNLRRMANELWLSTTDTGYWAYTLAEHLRIVRPDKALAATIMMSTGIYLIINYLDKYPHVSENPDCLRRVVLEMSPAVNRKILSLFRVDYCAHLTLDDFDIDRLFPINSLSKVIVLARLLSHYRDPFIEDLLIRKRKEMEYKLSDLNKATVEMLREQNRERQNDLFKIVFQY